MRRGSPGYFDRPQRRGVRTNTALRCICGRTFWLARELREHQERCTQARLERAEQGADRKAGA